MTPSSIVNEPDVVEYMKIRKFVISQIARCSGAGSMRLSSTREMAKRFGVSQPTVIRALKDLIADGHLIVKPGIGTFINPHGQEVRSDSKIFAIVTWDGKKSFIDRMVLNYETTFIDALLDYSHKFKVQNCELTSSLKEADVEIAQGGYDGVIWISPREDAIPAILRLKAAGMAVLIAGVKVDGISSCRIDFVADNYEVAKLMLQEGRQKIMLVAPAARTAACRARAADGLSGIKAAFREFGREFDPSWVVTEDERENFGRVLDLTKPDAIIFNVHIQPYLEAVRARHDIVSECRLYCGKWSISKDMNYTGYLGIIDLQTAAERAVANLVAQMNAPETAEILDFVMERKIVLHTDKEKGK